MLGPEMPPPEWATARPAGGRFLADDMGALVDLSTGACALAGFVSARDQLCQVRLDARRRALEAFSWADGVALEPGAVVRSERLLVDLAGPPLEALARYGDALGREMGARVPEMVTSGWCSWYRFFTAVREEDVLDNLRFLTEHRDELPVEYVQLDDGYQAGLGDWESINEKFPHGMKWLVDRIHEAGFKAGLWVAPFTVGADSALYREHPEWLIRDADGEPVLAIHNWNQRCYGLDCTHPEAQAWLEHLFRTVAEDWGFDFVKVDFIYSGALRGRRYDATQTRAQAYRRGLEIIRRAVGDRFVLGCGGLIAPSVGLVDGHRIGPDVALWWRLPPGVPVPARRKRGGWAASSFPAAENALRNILTRFWCHRRLWLNDPDCLLARDETTMLTLDEVQMPATVLSLDEVRTLATAIGLSGGMVLDSDNLPAMSPERVAIVSLLLPPWGEAALPLDLFETEMPSLFQLPVARPWESWTLLGVFNWEDDACYSEGAAAARPSTRLRPLVGAVRRCPLRRGGLPRRAGPRVQAAGPAPGAGPAAGGFEHVPLHPGRPGDRRRPLRRKAADACSFPAAGSKEGGRAGALCAAEPSTRGRRRGSARGRPARWPLGAEATTGAAATPGGAVCGIVRYRRSRQAQRSWRGSN